MVPRSVLKRRLIFDPLPETEPLLAKMQRALLKTKDLLHPCYYRRTLLEPEAPVRTGGPVTTGCKIYFFIMGNEVNLTHF